MLEAKSLTTAYDGLVAISDISLEVAAGEIIAVVGANGAGKSTLLKTIAGLEKPARGSILFEGREIAGTGSHKITAQGIALVPEGRRLFPRLSVRDNLRLGSYLFRSKADREAPLAQVFTLFPRLAERMDQRAETLSGGEQQMLSIGRALMTRPRLLMLDEPSQGIMPKLVDEILDAVVMIRASGTTILIVEQRLAETLAIADRAYVLQTGRVILQGLAAEINADVRCDVRFRGEFDLSAADAKSRMGRRENGGFRRLARDYSILNPGESGEGTNAESDPLVDALF
jgi:branched-chain amino acid transport system ATP-binding protein